MEEDEPMECESEVHPCSEQIDSLSLIISAEEEETQRHSDSGLHSAGKDWFIFLNRWFSVASRMPVTLHLCDYASDRQYYQAAWHIVFGKTKTKLHAAYCQLLYIVATQRLRSVFTNEWKRGRVLRKWNISVTLLFEQICHNIVWQSG